MFDGCRPDSNAANWCLLADGYSQSEALFTVTYNTDLATYLPSVYNIYSTLCYCTYNTIL